MPACRDAVAHADSLARLHELRVWLFAGFAYLHGCTIRTLLTCLHTCPLDFQCTVCFEVIYMDACLHEWACVPITHLASCAQPIEHPATCRPWYALRPSPGQIRVHKIAHSPKARKRLCVSCSLHARLRVVKLESLYAYLLTFADGVSGRLAACKATCPPACCVCRASKLSASGYNDPRMVTTIRKLT